MENMVHAIENNLFTNRLTPKEVSDIRDTVISGCAINGIIPLSKKYNVDSAKIRRIIYKKCWDDDLMSYFEKRRG